MRWANVTTPWRIALTVAVLGFVAHAMYLALRVQSGTDAEEPAPLRIVLALVPLAAIVTIAAVALRARRPPAAAPSRASHYETDPRRLAVALPGYVRVMAWLSPPIIVACGVYIAVMLDRGPVVGGVVVAWVAFGSLVMPWLTTLRYELRDDALVFVQWPLRTPMRWDEIARVEEAKPGGPLRFTLRGGRRRTSAAPQDRARLVEALRRRAPAASIAPALTEER